MNMKLMLFAFLGILFGFVIPSSRGCHNYHYRKRRQVSINEEVTDTSHLRRFFYTCLTRKAGRVFQSWSSVIDFVVLDTRWYSNSNNANCREFIGQDTPGCWKNRISDLLRANSSLGLFSRQCIDEYNDALSSNCLRGRWSRYFDRDDPVGLGDTETLRLITRDNPSERLCKKPLHVEAKVVNTGKDYTTSKQRVTVNPNLGLVCRNRDQNNTMCLDYKVRFCCPLEEQAFGSPILRRGKRQASFDYNPTKISNYTDCIMDDIQPIPGRPTMNMESVVNFAQNHLVCNSFGPNGDCSLNITTVSNNSALISTWPYRFQATIKPRSSLLSSVSTCNIRYFPLTNNNIAERIVQSPVATWSMWSTWGECRGGLRLRNRTCMNLDPGRNECQGFSFGFRLCQQPFTRALIKISYSSWSQFEPCPAQCGQLSSQNRTRQCTSSIGDAVCLEPLMQSRICKGSCASWGKWGGVSTCSQTCGSGKLILRRQCKNGTVGSEGCQGPTLKQGRCFSRPCSKGNINLSEGWTQWGKWEPCRASCNQRSRQIRRRQCITSRWESPNCQGLPFDVKICQKDCGTWSSWGEFSQCGGECGLSTQTRFRSCIGGEVGSENCFGATNHTKPCFTGRFC